jgi:hypothetical protein
MMQKSRRNAGFFFAKLSVRYVSSSGAAAQTKTENPAK